MGSIDPGPYYLGSGELATTPTATRRDLRKVLQGALKLKIPLVIGSAGSAGAKPHLDRTLSMVRKIAGEEGWHVADYKNGIVNIDPATGKVTPLLERAMVPFGDGTLSFNEPSNRISCLH